MIPGGYGTGRSGRDTRALPALALACALFCAIGTPAAAQMFSDRPPPVPPGLVPEPTAPAMNLAPPGPASIPVPAPLLTPPSVAAVPPVVPPSPSTAGQAVLSLTARYGKDLPVITGGLVWRVFADR
ncbi:MAG: hypothetical protein JWO88_3990, partial [Frankiales bacterium]|nr:hypothetical protein [Frankiales bacterium]